MWQAAVGQAQQLLDFCCWCMAGARAPAAALGALRLGQLVQRLPTAAADLTVDLTAAAAVSAWTARTAREGSRVLVGLGQQKYCRVCMTAGRACRSGMRAVAVGNSAPADSFRERMDGSISMI